jgi:hypothetical protein
MLDGWPDSDHRTRIVLIVQGSTGRELEARWADALPRLFAPASSPVAA